MGSDDLVLDADDRIVGLVDKGRRGIKDGRVDARGALAPRRPRDGRGASGEPASIRIEPSADLRRTSGELAPAIDDVGPDLRRTRGRRPSPTLGLRASCLDAHGPMPPPAPRRASP